MARENTQVPWHKSVTFKLTSRAVAIDGVHTKPLFKAIYSEPFSEVTHLLFIK